MESFYGDYIPRNAPNPTSFIQNHLTPSVPDVSMFSPNKHTNSKPSYQAWRAQQVEPPVSPYSSRKENFNPNNSIKQVSFIQPNSKRSGGGMLTERNSNDSFNLPPTPGINNQLELSILDNKSLDKGRQFLTGIMRNQPKIGTIRTQVPNSPIEIDLTQETVRSNPMQSQNRIRNQYESFQPIHHQAPVESVASHNLDPIQSNRIPIQNHQQFQSFNPPTQFQPHVTYNSNPYELPWGQPVEPPKQLTYKQWLLENERQQKLLEEQKLAEMRSKEPTVPDLYKIVKEQNDSLQNLQKQVEILLQKQAQQAVCEVEKNCDCKNRKETKTVETNTSINDPVQISIGVMTSFHLNVNNVNTEPKPVTPHIQEITPLTSKPVELQNKFFKPQNKFFQHVLPNNCSTKTGDGFCSSRFKEYSLSEIPEIPEPVDETMSSTTSIHVDMQEFHESSDEESSENEEEGQKVIGWTVYNNVVDQVKNILETSPREDSNCASNNRVVTVEDIQQATLKQLQNLGVNFGDLQVPGLDPRFLNKKNMGPNDVSVQVNQLVMKYLKDDQLSFLVTKNQVLQSPLRGKQFHQQNFRVTTSPVNGGSNEMSFATVKYMQKYRLLNSDDAKVPENVGAFNNVQHVITKPPGYHQMQDTRPAKYMSQNKILDITALKQQPKLL